MAQIEISEHDNDRLKNRKVKANLTELGVWPANPNERPNFLRSHRQAAALIDRALSNLAPAPVVLKRCSNRKEFAQAMNAKISTAFEAIASGDFMAIATNNAADGVYTRNGVRVSINDIIDMGHQYTDFDPVADIDAEGIRPRQSDGAGRTMELQSDLIAELVAAGGFTLLYEFKSTALSGTAPQGGKTAMDFTAMNAPETEYGYQFVLHRRSDNTDRIALADITGGNEAADATAGILSNAVNKIAFTITTSRVAASVNGNAVVTLDFPGISVNTTKMYLGFSGDLDVRLRKFQILDAKNDADLQALAVL